MYLVTDGSSQLEFVHFIDAKDWLNAHPAWYLVTQPALFWENAQIMTVPFKDTDSVSIQHNSGSYCIVKTIDSFGAEFECFKEDIDENNCVVSWSEDLSGKVLVIKG